MTTFRFYFVREHRLHGIITGLEAVKILSTTEDSLDRLLVSFKDAKVRIFTNQRYKCTEITQLALLEWSSEMHDLTTVSIHTYERAPQVVCGC